MRLVEIKFEYFLFCWFFAFLLKNREPFRFIALGPLSLSLSILDRLGFVLLPLETLNVFGTPVTHHPKGAPFFIPLWFEFYRMPLFVGVGSPSGRYSSLDLSSRPRRILSISLRYYLLLICSRD